MTTKAVVLAAGYGSRLGELTENLPKPLVRVGSQSVLEHDLHWLAAHGIEQVAINLHHLPDRIEALVGDGSAFGLAVHYHRESELQGTAGTCRALRDWLGDEAFVVVYGDNLLDFDLDAMCCRHAETPAITTLALFSPQTHLHTGIAGGRVEMDRTGRVLRFLEGVHDASLSYVNAGCYVVEPSLLQHVPDGVAFDYGRDLFPHVLRHQGILGGHVIDGMCLGIDTPEALAQARQLLGSKSATAP